MGLKNVYPWIRWKRRWQLTSLPKSPGVLEMSSVSNRRYLVKKIQEELRLVWTPNCLYSWQSFSAGGHIDTSNSNVDFDSSFEVAIFGDVIANDGFVPTDLSGASRFITNVAKYVAGANNGKGVPL